jgi:predicted metal-binding membrane protein
VLSQQPPSELHKRFFGVSALLFRCQRGGNDHLGDASMSAMAEDADARRLDDVDGVDAMPDRQWLGAAASFLGMWVVMMVAMMLPVLAPNAVAYRQAVGRTGETRLVG